LKLKALYALLDRCCEGLGALAQMKWTEVLLLLLSPDTAPARERPVSGVAKPALRLRARRTRAAAAHSLLANGM
jgi:hypothetical protein